MAAQAAQIAFAGVRSGRFSPALGWHVRCWNAAKVRRASQAAQRREGAVASGAAMRVRFQHWRVFPPLVLLGASVLGACLGSDLESLTDEEQEEQRVLSTPPPA